MDRKISGAQIRRERIVKWLKFAAVVLVFIFAILLFRHLIRSSLKRSQILTAVAEVGDIEDALTASGIVVPEYEQILTSPIASKIERICYGAGETVPEDSSILELNKDVILLVRLSIQLLPEIDSLIEVYNEMITRIRNERLEKQEQHFFLEKLIEASPAGIITLDFDKKISTINPAARRMLASHTDNPIGLPLAAVNSPLAAELLRLNPGESKVIALNGIQKYKCQQAHFLDRGFSRNFIIIEELTDEIIRTEKNAYGKVIRMMSHEVNNSIGAINSILNTVLQFKTQLSAADRADYEEALSIAIERNNNLNNFMANYADIIRLPTPRKEPLDIGDLLDRIKILMNSELQKRNIRWQCDYAPEPIRIQADVEQLEQVLMNIIKNAVEAIGNDGTITAITRSRPLPTLIIRDTGSGIAPEISANLFSPFFSTKKNGQGIGLTLTREILANHGFQFSLNTPQKNCTEFSIHFS